MTAATTFGGLCRCLIVLSLCNLHSDPLRKILLLSSLYRCETQAEMLNKGGKVLEPWEFHTGCLSSFLSFFNLFFIDIVELYKCHKILCKQSIQTEKKAN